MTLSFMKWVQLPITEPWTLGTWTGPRISLPQNNSDFFTDANAWFWTQRQRTETLKKDNPYLSGTVYKKKKKKERINKGQRPFCWKQGSHLIIFTSKSKDRRGKIRQASPFTRKPIFRHCHSGSAEILLMELVFGESSFHQNWHSLNLNY